MGISLHKKHVSDAAVQDAIARSLADTKVNPPLPGPSRIVDTAPVEVAPIVPPTGPVRVPSVDVGEPPTPMPSYIGNMERAAATDYKPNLSKGTGASLLAGATYPTRNPEIPLPAPLNPVDSNIPVSPPDAPGAYGPSRVDIGAVKRNAGESDSAYQGRINREYADQLRTAGQDSKVTKTATGVDVAPPKKLGRLAGAFERMRQLAPYGARSGIGGLGGAGLFGFLQGLINPGSAAKGKRREEQAKADQEVTRGENAQIKDLQAATRTAQLQEIKDLPGRREDAKKELERDNLRQTWTRITATGAFDPAGNPDHKKIQQRASELGEYLPATSVKAGPTREPHYVERRLPNGSTETWVIPPAGSPDKPSRVEGLPGSSAPPKPEDTAGENKNLENEATRAKEQGLERESRAEAERIGKEATRTEAELKTAEADVAKFGNVLESVQTTAQKSAVVKMVKLREKLEKLRSDESEAWSKRAGHDIAAQNIPTLKTKSSGPARLPYAGQTFPMSQIAAWAQAHNVTPEAARATFEAQGATVKP